MFQIVMTIVKWVSIPVLLTASMLSRFTASFELLVDILVCLGAILILQRAIRSRDYLWAAGLVPIVVVFSPVSLVVKVFLLMGLTCIATLVSVFMVFRMRPLAAD